MSTQKRVVRKPSQKGVRTARASEAPPSVGPCDDERAATWPKGTPSDPRLREVLTEYNAWATCLYHWARRVHKECWPEEDDWRDNVPPGTKPPKPPFK